MTYKEFLKLYPYHKIPVTCTIYGTKITDAKLSKDKDGCWYICQNKIDGRSVEDKLGYKYSWFIFFGNKGDDEEIHYSVTILTFKPMYLLSNIKAGDLITVGDGNYRRALSDVMYPELG
jgi:hypothetical protein